MKTLIVYYSRTEITKKVADNLATKLNADVEEVIDKANYKGAVGYMRAGRAAMKESLTEIEEFKVDISQYDLVILGTPIWGWNMTPAIRTILNQYKDKINKVAFYCTMGGSGDVKAFTKMSEILGKKPVAKMSLLTKEVVTEQYQSKVEEFIKKI